MEGIMDVDTFTDYEIVVPETSESFIVKERYEALAYLKDTYMVFERHHTVHNPTLYAQTQLIITRQLHNNPDFREEV
jgi:predicted transcriptional regulator YdeE